MRSSVWLVAALCFGLSGTAEAQRYNRYRFQELDRNGDRTITRDEWRGNDRSFRNQDWNGDGVLSGIELRIGAQRPPRNRDMVGTSGRTNQFADLDRNGDGRLTRGEWLGSAAVFDALDANGDGVLTQLEAVGTNAGTRNNEFTTADVNGDGVVARNEWQWNPSAFDRLDANRDGRLTRDEFDNPQPTVGSQQSAAFRAGYARGQSDGIQAGREDKPRHWDLEGQRELETADAGYEGRLGSLTEYQAGYRTGFRRGYREGFGSQ